MLAFAHIPTGATAPTKELISMIRRIVRRTSQRAEHTRSRSQNRQGYTLRRGSGCRTNGVHLSFRSQRCRPSKRADFSSVQHAHSFDQYVAIPMHEEIVVLVTKFLPRRTS
jgi:hypothetical protein